MDASAFISKYKQKNKLPLPGDHLRRVEACLSLQVHTKGVRPAFDSNRGYIQPESYDKKFDTIFATRLLNRHPNENLHHYNWRLSVYSPVAKEIYDKFVNLCKGAILQPNNYSISAEGELDSYLKQYRIGSVLSDAIEFVLCNPVGYYAVLYGRGELDETETTRPYIHFIACEDVLMKDDDSIAFLHGGGIVYLDNYRQINYDKKTFAAIEYQHGFGELPLYDYTHNFTQPFQFWADVLVRNMNDDEAITKHYSYPIVQVVEQQCTVCYGNCTISTYNEQTQTSDRTECTACNGKGTITRNPGDFYTLSEEVLAKNGGNMYDMARFITPDVGIPEYHFKRWQTFYERCEFALHLRSQIEGVQSGEAKREDRKDQYFFLQSISDFIFDIVQNSMKFISAYLNIRDGRHEPTEVLINRPKQFDIMSDVDLVKDIAALQATTDDTQTLSELNYVVNRKIYRDDPVQLKINEVLYLTDPLFGISGKALSMKLLSGVYTVEDKIIHEKGYKLLTNIAYEVGADVFAGYGTIALKQKLNEAVAAIKPAGVYD